MGTPAIEPQRVLAGRYRLEERLGSGGMGTIWRAEHLVLQAPVAVKLIENEGLRDPDNVGRFLREAKAAATLRSPHVVQIIDYGVDDGIPFIVMELLEGETLAQRLKRVQRLPPADTARFMAHVGRAVSRAHEAGIVHRDLKPENVFLVPNEDAEIAKVLDFGVAKIEPGVLGPEPTRTRTGSVLGTPYYMSPEQAQGNKAVDHRSDLWSLGVIAFECLTGRRPFYSDGLGDLVLQICVRDIPIPSEITSVPIGFDAWFERAMMRDPELRFQSAREMTDALREALGVETRDVGTQPEVVVSTGSFESRELEVGRDSYRRDLDGKAATVALAPEVVERLASSTMDPAPLPERSGITRVFAVAAVALSVGLGGGLFALRNQKVAQSVPSPEARALPLPEPPSSAAAALSASKGDIGVAPPPSAAAGAREVAPPASASAPVRRVSAPPVVARSAEPNRRAAAPAPAAPASTPESAAPAPREGWVKPDWAQPDEPTEPYPEPAAP